MQKAKTKNQKLLLKAREIFADANQYNDCDLLGYCKLVKALCKRLKRNLSGKLYIANIQKVLSLLDKRTQTILDLRYWEGCTRVIVGTRLNISRERVRQLECRAQEIMAFLIHAQDEFPIEVLNLNIRGYRALKHEGVNTVEQLVNLTRRDLTNIKGIGTGALEDIKRKLWQFVINVAHTNPGMFENLPIESINLSTRLTNSLKRNNIFIIKELMVLSEDKIYRLKGVGDRGRRELAKKREEIKITTNNYSFK